MGVLISNKVILTSCTIRFIWRFCHCQTIILFSQDMTIMVNSTYFFSYSQWACLKWILVLKHIWFLTVILWFFKGFTSSSIAEEKQYNPRLTKNREDFINFMSNLQLAYPKMIDRAVPANMTCGLFDQAREENK